MRNSPLLKWAQNNRTSAKGRSSKGERKWVHAPDQLLHGHVVYLVKFLGSTEVDQPKGIEVVKQGIQKLKFSQQLRKSSEGSGSKTPKVELTISVDGVAIQEPKAKRMLHQYPLHKISYCADDKAEKRFFSFIAKEADNNHTCFVFVSDKLAEEITLTIGQAFELAYKRFLETSGRDAETRKQLSAAQRRLTALEAETEELKRRLRDVAAIKGSADVAEYMRANQISDLCHVEAKPDVVSSSETDSNNKPKAAEDNKSSGRALSSSSGLEELICLGSSASAAAKLDGLTLDDLNDDDFNPRSGLGGGGLGLGIDEDDEDDDSDSDDFDPRAASQPPSVLAPPPALPPRTSPSSALGMTSLEDNPFSAGADDPFGMAMFSNNNNNNNGTAIVANAKAFSLDDLDPLKK